MHQPQIGSKSDSCSGGVEGGREGKGVVQAGQAGSLTWMGHLDLEGEVVVEGGFVALSWVEGGFVALGWVMVDGEIEVGGRGRMIRPA